MAQQRPVALSIAIVQGDGAVNFVNQKPMQVPVVRVEDSSGRAVAGAKVSFEAPASGPGATFKGARTYAAVTGRDGTVKAAGFVPNMEAGPFMVHVVAEYDGQTSDKQITQNNVTPPPAAKSGHRRTALKVAIGVAAAAGFGVILYEEFIAKNKPYGQR
ncbi:MAG TPA: hypothetical protein VKU19_11695 [Bryobacteraceae bacterium]|nr:hypothetical protein [Bryobacteraceae bacterium]